MTPEETTKVQIVRVKVANLQVSRWVSLQRATLTMWAESHEYDCRAGRVGGVDAKSAGSLQGPSSLRERERERERES